MEENDFIPVGLPLLSNAVLLKTMMEYRYARSLLTPLNTPLSRKTQSRIDDALQAIEIELEVRGLAHSDDGLT